MKAIWLVPVIVMAVGCGGGGASDSGAATPSEAEFAFGTLVGRAASTNPPLTTTSSTVAATGLTGTITSLKLSDQVVRLDEHRIVFTSDMASTTANRDIYTCNLDGSELVRVTSTPGINEFGTVPSPDGKRLAFLALGTGGDEEIFVMNIDGTNRVQLTNNSLHDKYPRWHPSGNLITYWDNFGNIHIINVNTKAVTTIVDDEFFNQDPCFTADGQSIVFQSQNRLGDSLWHLHIVPVVAAGPVSTFVVEGGNNQWFPRLAPDGLQLAYFTSQLNGQRVKHLGGDPVTGPVADTVEWSPDSTKVMYSRSDLDYKRLAYSNPDGSNEVELLGNINAAKVWPAFIPAPKEVVFVGPGSLFGSRLAGMIFSQSGPTVRGLLGFDANTPSTAVLTRQTDGDTDSPNLIFSIDADVVREISYAHAPYWKPTRVVGSGSGILSANGALVSIDSATGRIVAVLPFAGSRNSRPSFHDHGNARVFTGNFLGAFDSSGRNQANGQVSEVRLNLATSELSAY